MGDDLRGDGDHHTPFLHLFPRWVTSNVCQMDTFLKPRSCQGVVVNVPYERQPLGARDEAMHWLELGYEERFNPGVLIRPGFDPLRADPRFQALVRRVGLPE